MKASTAKCCASHSVVLGRRKGSYTKTNVLLKNKSVIVNMLDADISVNSICRQFKLSRETFYKFQKSVPEVNDAVKRKEWRKSGHQA